MKRRHAMRRPNGVGAYHMYLGELLKKAKLKGKSKSERNAAFKQAQAKALELSKGKGFSEKFKSAAKSVNAAVQAKKLRRRAQRGRRVVIGKRGGKVVVPAMRKSAYKALKPYARLKVRKAAGAIVPRGPRKAAAARPSARPPALAAAPVRASAAKASSRKASSRKASSRKASSRKASAASGKGFSGIKVGAKGRNMYFLDGKMVAEKVYKAARPGSSSRASQMMDNPKHGKKHRKARRKAQHAVAKRGMIRRLKNTGEGILAAEKSFYSDLVTVPGFMSVLGVGIAHGVFAPMIAESLEKALPRRFDVPFIGSVGASNLAFTGTGAVAAGVLVGLGATVAKKQKDLLNKMAMLALGGGALMDVVGIVMNRGGSQMGAIDNDGTIYGAIDADGVVYGDIAYGAIDNDGTVYGDIAYGGLMEDGTNVSYGDVISAEYADAMPADAEDSGADFSVAEGQAMVEGPLSWMKRFGKSPVRATGIRGIKSRHAGREGHRWGWMYKLVGPEKMQQIAALPPQQRLEVIAKLRKAALESLANSLNAAATQTTAQIAPAQNLLPAPQDMGLDLTGAVGAAGGAYGATMYAGGGF